MDILLAFAYKSTVFLEYFISVHSYMSINILLILIVWRAIISVIEELGKKKLFFLKMIGKLRALHAKKHDSTIMLINYIHIHTFLHFSVYMYVCEYHTN